MTKKQKIIIFSISSGVVILLAIFFISYIIWNNEYKGKISKGIFLGDIYLGEKTSSEALETLSLAESEFRLNGIIFSYGEKTASFPLRAESVSPDIPESNFLYADSVYYDKEKTVNALVSKTWLDFVGNGFKKLTKKETDKIFLEVEYSSSVLEKWLKTNFPELNIEPEPAYFSFDEKTNSLINNQEKIGKEIDFTDAFKSFDNHLKTFNKEPIIVKTKSKYPEVKQSDLEPLREQGERFLNSDSFSLVLNETDAKKISPANFKVTNKELITWISPIKSGQETLLSINQEKVANYLEKAVSPKINLDVVLPRFEVNSGKVSSWRTGENGRELDINESVNNIISALSQSLSSSTLVIKELRVDDLEIENNFKIKEIIGTGHSNFAGSPANRRHNIKVGAEAVHGMLIEPGKEFSLVETLGEIDAAAGYLPELVIKGNKTIPEYGGGLCQIATTIFRSALSSGLPITERRNHSYRVSYYEPAGTDAAVYDPWPDIKFLNDTGNYILIQTKIDGNDIYFDFWGTKDGRISSVTEPVIYNIVKPPATKIIETDELKPGEKKCTEKAHNGADAYFDYVVIYPEGATTTPKQETRFRSHYVPWQEVCLVGKTPASESVAPEEITTTLDQKKTASSTN